MCKCDEDLQKLSKAKAEWHTSGPVHRRDLSKYIQRLERKCRCDACRRDQKKKDFT